MNSHIIACDGTNPEYPFGFACLHCGAKKRLNASLPLVVYIDIAQEFRRQHTGCKKAGDGEG